MNSKIKPMQEDDSVVELQIIKILKDVLHLRWGLINFEIREKKLLLTGVLDNQEEKNELLKKIKLVKYISKVDSRLEVKNKKIL